MAIVGRVGQPETQADNRSDMTTLSTIRRAAVLATLLALFPGASGVASAAEGVDKSYLHSPYHLSKYDKVFYSFNGRVWTHLPIEEKPSTWRA